MLRNTLCGTTLFLMLMVLPAHSGGLYEDLRSSTFDQLEQIRNERKDVIISHLNKLLKKTVQAASDPALINAFHTFYRNAAEKSLGSRTALPSMNALDEHYVNNYGQFYDILFVSSTGFVFHSIKMEWDYGKNLFTSRLSNTKLSNSLRTNPNARFIDYDYYSPSKEPASFFVTKIPGKNGILGWIVFQFSVNRINSILSNYENLGITGEIYLTNRKKLMLTQSRLVSQETSLTMNVNTKSLSKALESNIFRGEMIIDDYRGVRVFSSFDKFDFEGVVWVIVAEIDENEIVSNHYRRNKEYYLPKIYQRLTRGKSIFPQQLFDSTDNIRVDINEFSKGKTGDALVTHGIATCTGVSVSYPGKFAYVGHINPLDKMYQSFFEKTWGDIVQKVQDEQPGEGDNDLLGGMLKKIKYYDIPPAEIHKLRALVAAVHKKSFERVIDTLLDAGFFLSQIRVLDGSESRYVNLGVDVSTGKTVAQWVGRDGYSSIWTTSEGVPDLGWIVRFISGDTELTGKVG